MMAGPIAERAYEATTRGVRVLVTPRYDAERSDPEAGRWFWTYEVRIENHGGEPVRLLSRHWVITDGQNRTEEVRGPGVVGETPRLAPGEGFDYASGCPLPTASGSMHGAYEMVTDAGDTFEARIPAFSLHLPGASRRLN
jgi:ApaG protein